MGFMNRPQQKFTKGDWWTIRSQNQKRIIKAIILICVVIGAIVVSITISYDHENPTPGQDFDPDYMLGGGDKLLMDAHYNKRWKPPIATESQPKTTKSDLRSWEEAESILKWYHQNDRTTASWRRRTTTTTTRTTTTTTTPAPTTTTTTEAPTTTTIMTTETTIPTTTTTTTTPHPPTSTPTTQVPTMSTTTENSIHHHHTSFRHNETSGTHSEVDDLSPSNSNSLNTTASYDSVTISQDYRSSNRFNQTSDTFPVNPEVTTEINLGTNNDNSQDFKPPHFGKTTTETTQSFEETQGFDKNHNANDTVQNQVHTPGTEDEGHLSSVSHVGSQDFENLTESTTPETITTPVPKQNISNVFHVNASMKISSSIDSETLASAARHRRPKTTEEVPTVTEPISDYSYPQSNICLEDECFIVARKLNQSIDDTIEPCENFYQHVCGNWGQYSSSESELIGIKGPVLNPSIKEDIKNLLIQPPLQYDSKAVKNVKKLYRACVTRMESDRVSLLLLQKAMSKLTNFVRKSKTEKHRDLSNLASHLVTLGSNYLFPIGVVKDRKNVSRNILHIGINKPLLLTKKNYESRLPYFNALRDLITEISNIIGVKTIVHKVLGFELLLSQITPEYSQEPEEEYNPTTIGELESTTNVTWRRIFQSALDLTGENITIGLNELVIVQSKEYLKKLLDLLNDTDESDLIDYTVIRFILPKLDAMPKQFYKLYQRYKKIISGIEDEDRELSCVIFAGNMMPGVVGKIYADRYFSEAVKYRNIHVPKMIHATALEMIRKLAWMDKSTKLRGLKKMYSMLQMIGNDETLSGDPFINQFQFMDDHMKNLFVLDKYRTLSSFSKLRSVNSRGQWAVSSHPFEMKSFYSPEQNAIYIPAAMFQEPLFHDDLPLTMQFGALGSTVGHAYIHAIDVIGSKFDDNGNMKTWWSKNTRKGFKSRIATLNSHSLQEFGERDIVESSADIGGIKISWRALKKMQKEFNLTPLVLPGLNYTSDQLFYINYARAWCDQKLMVHAMDSVGRSPKVPAKSRVIITLQNMPSFSQAFRCKVGDYMNPKGKTHIW